VITEFILIFSLAGLAYIYVGYPLFVFLISAVGSRRIQKQRWQPSVTVLIAAYNEEASIEATIRNKLELEYPREQLEIIVVSDCSSDDTDDIVKRLAPEGVRLLRQDQRGGKTAALNRAVGEARGEIIVFSDANSTYEAQALQRLVDNFSDPQVGYVTGKMLYTDPDGSVIGDGCSAYMKYENLLRSLETRVGSVVGVDGGIDAVRASLYRQMDPDQLPDFVLPLSVVEQGSRVVYEPLAILREETLNRPGDEYRMRVRVSLRALWALHDMRCLLNIFKYGRFSWQLASHKVLRYGAFILLLSAYLTNWMLRDAAPWWTALLVVQSCCYLAALFSLLSERWGVRIRLFYFPYYFTLINVAAAHAFMKYLAGKKQVLWTPRKG
jgi:cellulose synthase/poly-beta-1,6-N-acetylglucosamine synthase-like glycosyltransferase